MEALAVPQNVLNRAWNPYSVAPSPRNLST